MDQNTYLNLKYMLNNSNEIESKLILVPRIGNGNLSNCKMHIAECTDKCMIDCSNSAKRVY